MQHATAPRTRRGFSPQQLATRVLEMPRTGWHLVSPPPGEPVAVGADVVVEFDAPMPGASAVLVRPSRHAARRVSFVLRRSAPVACGVCGAARVRVHRHCTTARPHTWRRRLQSIAGAGGAGSTFLVTELARGLSTAVFPAPAFCAGTKCAIEARVSWPRLAPAAAPGELPWPPLPPGSHAAEANDRLDGLSFEVEAAAPGAGTLTATVTAPAAPVAAGEPFDVAVSVRTCKGRGGVVTGDSGSSVTATEAPAEECGDAQGDVRVFVFAVDAAWAGADSQPIPPADPVATITSLSRRAPSGATARPAFESTLDTLVTVEQARTWPQVRCPPPWTSPTCVSHRPPSPCVPVALAPRKAPVQPLSRAGACAVQLAQVNRAFLAANPFGSPTDDPTATAASLLRESTAALHEGPGSDFAIGNGAFPVGDAFDDLYDEPSDASGISGRDRMLPVIGEVRTRPVVPFAVLRVTADTCARAAERMPDS